jgi:eukaryotic-like serine/threonine-protein kinase
MRIFDVLHNIASGLGRLVKRMLPDPKDSQESKNFKTTLYFLAGCILFMGLVAIVALVAFLQPVDETVIPNLAGSDFREALVILQNKKLQTYVNFEFTTTPQDKDLILRQDPAPREKVRIGSRVTLWVSQGAAFDRVGNYVDKTLSEVEALFRSSFNKDREVIAIKKPINYISHKSPAGTILAQNPAPGTPLSDRTLFLELTVSKGRAASDIIVGNYTGQYFLAAIETLQSANISFVFVVKDEMTGAPGSVVSQNVAPGTKIDAGVVLVLEMNRPANISENKVFGLYTCTLPDFGAPILVKIEADLFGKRTPLLTQERFGGRLTIPYILDKDAEIVLTVADEEKPPIKVRSY